MIVRIADVLVPLLLLAAFFGLLIVASPLVGSPPPDVSSYLSTTEHTISRADENGQLRGVGMIAVTDPENEEVVVTIDYERDVTLTQAGADPDAPFDVILMTPTQAREVAAAILAVLGH